MDLNIKDKIYFVSASSKGIGYGIAKVLVQNGAHILIGSRDKDNVMDAEASLAEENDTKILAHALDSADYKSIEEWVNFGISELGSPDGLVINAGGPPAGKFLDFQDDDWQKAFDLTLMSAVRMVNMVLPYMRSKGYGSVLSVTSSSVKEPIDNLLLSNVMRSGVTSLMKSLSIEFGPENIRFNNLVPGRIDTGRVKVLDEISADNMGVTSEESRHLEESKIPLKRYGEIDEIGKAGAFLLSEAASYINGVTLLVDGGKTKTVW